MKRTEERISELEDKIDITQPERQRENRRNKKITEPQGIEKL